jgi:hypothetical protein
MGSVDHLTQILHKMPVRKKSKYVTLCGKFSSLSNYACVRELIKHFWNLL